MVRMALSHAAFCSAHLDQTKFWSISMFSGHSHMFGLMGFQLLGIFEELNALAGLPNQSRNVRCSTWHLPGPLGPATAQRRPTFLYRRISAFWGLRRHFEITQKSGNPMLAENIGQPHAPSTWESGDTNGTY